MLQKIRDWYRWELFRPWVVAAVLLIVFSVLGFFRGYIAEVSSKFKLAAGLFLFMWFFWAFFFSQFVLPLRNSQERWLANTRLWLYTIGFHGPAIIVRNGKINGTEKELNRRWPGVVVLDAASAGVLKKPTHITRTIGPGVTFTNKDESVAGLVDLHIQKRYIGPWESDPSFVPIGPDESIHQFTVRSERRTATRALTLDGIEIIPNISVNFQINALPCEGGSEFGFRSSSVYDAVIRRTIDAHIPITDKTRLQDWDWLPTHLAADVWREMVGKFLMIDFFQSIPGKPGAFALIQKIVQSRLCSPQYDEVDARGKLTGRKIASPEYSLLEKRGIRAFKVRISNLRFEDSVEEQLVSIWKSSWLNRAIKERSDLEVDRKRIRENGRRAGLWQYSDVISTSILRTQSSSLLDGRSILRQLIQGSINILLNERRSKEDTKDELKQLTELMEWLERGTDASNDPPANSLPVAENQP